MKTYKKIFIVLSLVFLGIQFIPTVPNESSEVLPEDFVTTFNAPEDIKSLLQTSCYDCHSNNTIYPWYNKLQPVSWFMSGHIEKAKEELNLSEFGGYSGRRQRSKIKSIVSQIRDNEMPLPSYVFIHRDAKLSDDEKTRLENWLTQLRDSI